MGSEDVLVEIHPTELRFLVEVKRQSFCSVHLVNKSDEYVAFKVKTTSPKRYCVRPNVGVILPLASCDFTVTMQALKNAPPDLQTKDKFLVQTTVVPFGTADEDIVPAFFSKGADRYIEEKKLKVVLVSMTQVQVEQPTSGVPYGKETIGAPVEEEIPNNVNEAPNVANEVRNSLKATLPSSRGTASAFSKMSSPVKERPTVLQDFLVRSRQASSVLSESASNLQGTSSGFVESQFSSTGASIDLNRSPPLEYSPAPSEVLSLSDKESIHADNRVPSLSDKESINADNLVASLSDKESINADNHRIHATEDVESLQMKLNKLEAKLEDAEALIVKLREVTRTTIQERDKLRKDMVFLKSVGAARSQISTGFPLLFVIYMAVVGMSLGYLLHL